MHVRRHNYLSVQKPKSMKCVVSTIIIHFFLLWLFPQKSKMRNQFAMNKY